MDPINVKTSRIDENQDLVANISERKSVNIDACDADDAIAEDKKNDNDECDTDDSKHKDISSSDLAVTPQESNDGSSSEISDSEAANGSDEANDSKYSLSADQEHLFFSNNNGPVFPARHNRDLQMSLSHTSVEQNSLSNHDDEHNFHSSNILSKKPIGLFNDEEKTSVLKSLKRSASFLSSNQEPNFLSSSNISSSINQESIGFNKNGAHSSADGEAESLPPLNASFFNCQFQTPSWIDDPLIGVPPSAMENKNTHRKTGADMRILTAYMRSLNEMRLPEAIPPTELDKYLSSFFLVVRKADGSEYEPCSLRAMLASIERYLRFKNYPLSLTRDSAFSNMRNVLKLKQQTLRSIGKGQKAPSEVSPSSLAREGKISQLFKSQEMGPYTPSSVVFTLCFYFCMYLRLRKSTENKKLMWGDIVLCKDDSGREFLTFSSQMLRRTQSSSKLNLKQRIFRVWADPTCPEKDPVTIYKFYAQKRPTSMNTNFAPFYLGINVLYPTQGQLWYRPAAMGINKLNEMVRQIRDITGVRSTSDFHGELNFGEKRTSDLDLGSRDDQSPSHDLADKQDSECEVKMEVGEDGEEDDLNSNLAIDFSHEQSDPPLDCSQHNGSAASFSHIGLTAVNSGTHPVFSDGENSNSSSQQSISANINGDLNTELRNGKADKEIDLTKDTNPDFPLNCSTKGRANYSISENFNQFLNPVASLTAEVVSVSEAKQHLMEMVRRMDLSDLQEFDQWLKKVKFSSDPLSGEVVCKVEESMNVKATSSTSAQGANIILNISLTPQALQGEGPITVTAQTSIPSEQQHSSSSSKINSHHSKNISASKHSSTFSLGGLPHSTTTSLPSQSSADKPLDLVTSPVSRNTKSSLLTSHAKSSRSHGSNGIFPSLTTASGSSGFDSSLAKRLRLSAEQAEAYTSASIMAGLSSNFVNERLRLQLMQAGLRMGEYGLDAHTASFMDVANSEALRAQLLQHYGIKSEPK